MCQCGSPRPTASESISTHGLKRAVQKKPSHSSFCPKHNKQHMDTTSFRAVLLRTSDGRQGILIFLIWLGVSWNRRNSRIFFSFFVQGCLSTQLEASDEGIGVFVDLAFHVFWGPLGSAMG